MEIIDKLESTRDRTLRYFDLPEADLRKAYGSGKWSVRFLLHHLADAETVLNDRLRRTISEPRSVLWAFDQDAWSKGLDYETLPLDVSRGIYEATRAGIIYLAREHYARNGHLEFVHSETGVRTLKDEFDKVGTHNEGHLAHIETALASRS
jgi:DinB superfamily